MAAAPKMMRVLAWPVRPKGWTAIMQLILLCWAQRSPRALLDGVCTVSDALHSLQTVQTVNKLCECRLPRRTATSLSRSAALGQEHGNLPVGLLLIVRVRRVGLDRPLPPDSALITLQFAGGGVEAICGVLHHQRVGIGLEVE